MSEAHSRSFRGLRLGLALLFPVLSFPAYAQTFAQNRDRTIYVDVDATEAARNILSTRLTIPVKRGPLTLFYTKWIPGDVVPDIPAAKAGLAPGMKLIGVNGRTWSIELPHDSIAATKGTTTPLELLAENGGFTQTYKLDYHGGERYPHLERETAKPDFLSELKKPHAQRNDH